MSRIVAIAVVLTLSGCAVQSLWVRDGSRAGQRDFERSCAVCHGLGGHGDGPMRTSLRTPPPDLTRLAERHAGGFPEGYVIGVVTGRIEVDSHGTREMPVWSDRFSPSGTGGAAAASIFARRSASALADYLRSIQLSSRP